MIHSVPYTNVGLCTVFSGVDPESIFLRKVLDHDISVDGWVLPHGTTCAANSCPPAASPTTAMWRHLFPMGGFLTGNDWLKAASGKGLLRRIQSLSLCNFESKMQAPDACCRVLSWALSLTLTSPTSEKTPQSQPSFGLVHSSSAHHKLLVLSHSTDQKRCFLTAPLPQQGNSSREAPGDAGQQQHLIPFP